MPLPEPGKDEVRLRVQAIGLNRAEVMFRNGQYLIQPNLHPTSVRGAACRSYGSRCGQANALKSLVLPCFKLNQSGILW